MNMDPSMLKQSLNYESSLPLIIKFDETLL